MSKEDQIDREFREAYLRVNGGFDTEIGSEAVATLIETLRLQGEYLKKETQKLLDGKIKMTPDRAARMLSYTAKVIDEMTRLISFARGKHDSRPDLGDGWLAGLTEEQLNQVYRWIEENKIKNEV